jgi:hypothetical protein
MPDFGRPDFRGSGPQNPSLDAVRRTDHFIDALAGARPVHPQDAADAELAALLGNWRDELRWPPATGLLSDADVMAAFNAGRAQKRSGPDPQRWTDTSKRNRRSLSVIGASAAAVLCIGGFGAVVAGSGPGDALYGVRTMLFGAPKQVRDDQVGLAAKTELSQVQTLIAQGDWEQAQDKLVAVSTQVATIDDQVQKQELLDQFNDLSAKVVERDPAATAPPGVVYTVPPSSAALVPAVEPTSTPGAPPSPATSTTETASSASTSSSSATTSAAPTTSSTSASEASSSASSSATSSPATTSAAPQSQQTTTPTSAAPTTTTAPPSAAAPSSPASPTSVAASPEAPRAASSTAPAQGGEPAQAPVSETSAPAEAPSPSAQIVPAPAGESVIPSAAITTTVLVPAPAGP